MEMLYFIFYFYFFKENYRKKWKVSFCILVGVVYVLICMVGDGIEGDEVWIMVNMSYEIVLEDFYFIFVGY